MTAETFMAEFRRNPKWVASYRVVADGQALVDMKDIGGRVYLDALLVPSEERGRGQGRAGLQYVLWLADKHDVVLLSHVQRFGSSRAGLSQSQLRAWYKRYGFQVARNGTMIRHPADKPVKPKSTRPRKTLQLCAPDPIYANAGIK